MRSAFTRPAFTCPSRACTACGGPGRGDPTTAALICYPIFCNLKGIRFLLLPAGPKPAAAAVFRRSYLGMGLIPALMRKESDGIRCKSEMKQISEIRKTKKKKPRFKPVFKFQIILCPFRRPTIALPCLWSGNNIEIRLLKVFCLLLFLFWTCFVLQIWSKRAPEDRNIECSYLAFDFRRLHLIGPTTEMFFTFLVCQFSCPKNSSGDLIIVCLPVRFANPKFVKLEGAFFCKNLPYLVR